ncbi:MAG: tRNA (guanosine(46)-N7)-methyltransferase TrmB [Beijerinckiaceae bacterium]
MSEHKRPDDGRTFFGRRVSHKLRAGREASVNALLPRLRVPSHGAIADPATLFAPKPAQTWLEIGFGGGEHLLARAREHPDVGVIGCEAYVDGVARLIGEIERSGVSNIRIHDADAISLIERLPAASIDRIYLLYPDPWPKRRQRKRRFVSSKRLASLARILRPGGEFRFATDIDDYAAWVLARVLASKEWRWEAKRASDWTAPWPNWISTRYEKKALREGRVPSYLTFVRA